MSVKKVLYYVLLLLISTGVQAKVILTDIKGVQTPFSALQGKWVMINYWASWCQPCIDEISELNRFYRQNKQHVALFAVNYDALPLQEQRELIKRLGISYPSLREDPRHLLKLGDLRGVPATFVFNPQGELSTVLYGSQTLSSLKRAIQS